MKKLLVGVAVAALAGGASAVPVQWTAASGGNDHWYEYVDSMVSWQDAFAATSGIGADGRNRARQMRDVLVHRGPDGAGLWADDHARCTDGPVALVDHGNIGFGRLGVPFCTGILSSAGVSGRSGLGAGFFRRTGAGIIGGRNAEIRQTDQPDIAGPVHARTTLGAGRACVGVRI